MISVGYYQEPEYASVWVKLVSRAQKWRRKEMTLNRGALNRTRAIDYVVKPKTPSTLELSPLSVTGAVARPVRAVATGAEAPCPVCVHRVRLSLRAVGDVSCVCALRPRYLCVREAQLNK